MTLQHAREGALTSVAAIRWPYRVLAVASPTRKLTGSEHDVLLDHGIDLHSYEDGPSALLNLLAEDPAAVLAPTDLAGADLIRFVSAITARSSVPIIVGLVDDDGHELAFRALDAGARGLLALPFLPDQLASALKQLGLTKLESAGVLRYGAVELDRAAHRVVIDDTSVYLSPREFSLVEYLLAEAPRVVPPEEIAAVIGEEGNPGNTLRLRNYIKRVRRRISAARPDRPVIETIRGHGYRIAEN